MYNYVQIVGGEEKWQPVPANRLAELVASQRPMFTTVLSVSSLVDESTTKEELDKLTFLGPMYFDWDGPDIDDVLPQVRKFIQKLADLGVDPETLLLYATGGKGFHCEVPMPTFFDKLPKAGVANLPVVYKEIALELAVDTLDLRVYSGRKGRMWRQPNVVRPNGKYKVPITYAELMSMDAASYAVVTGSTRGEPVRRAPAYALNLAMLFDKCKLKVSGALARRKKNRVATATLRGDMPSLQALCEGRGLKPGTGFNQISLQMAIIAHQLNWTETQLVENCAGLISSHQSDGRHNTESKRASDLVRMHRYTDDNPCYDVSVGAIKTILAHSAPDLDGIPVSKEDVETAIVEAVENPTESSDTEPDEYEGLAGVTLNKFGIYAVVEGGTKRICAVSFANVEMLKSMDTGTISAIETDILVNGKKAVRQGLELDVFSSVQNFNRFCARFGHAFQGNDSNIRGVYMRVVESAKKSGKEFYVTSREGLDIVSIPNHDNPNLREPFMLWADGKGVVLEPRVANEGLNIRFQGYPDTRGSFRIDLGDAPVLTEWLKDDQNKIQLRKTLKAMMACQRPAAIGKLLGWTTACFYRMLFHKGYGKFPIMHINAPAGTGKSEMMKAALGMFYYHQEPRILSPSSTVFALSYSASGSVTPPLVIDEYKPHEMAPGVHDKLKLLFRDAYNAREQQRGGGTRDNDDYRSIHSTVLSAPMAFIAEAAEEESALMERVVLTTLSRPHPTQGLKDFHNFSIWQRNANLIAILGQYLATQIVLEYSVAQLQAEFDPMYDEAKQKFMLTEKDMGSRTLTEESLREKQATKERTVFNFTVAAFGLKKIMTLVNSIFPNEFSREFAEMREGVYERMSDLNATTQAEWIKVFNAFSDMSMAPEGVVYRLEAKKDYAIVNYGDKDCLELYTRSAYSKYRMYCRASNTKALYAGEQSFVHGLKDCPALAGAGISDLTLRVPGGSHVFDLQALIRSGFRGMREIV